MVTLFTMFFGRSAPTGGAAVSLFSLLLRRIVRASCHGRVSSDLLNKDRAKLDEPVQGMYAYVRCTPIAIDAAHLGAETAPNKREIDSNSCICTRSSVGRALGVMTREAFGSSPNRCAHGVGLRESAANPTNSCARSSGGRARLTPKGGWSRSDVRIVAGALGRGCHVRRDVRPLPNQPEEQWNV